MGRFIITFIISTFFINYLINLPTYTIFSSNPKHFRKDFYVDWNIY